MDLNELNKVLSSEIYKLRSNKTKPEKVKAITGAASQIIAGARLQLSYMKMIGAPVLSPAFGKLKALPAAKKNGSH